MNHKTQPCPFCGCSLSAKGESGYYVHPAGQCFLREYEFDDDSITAWNQRAVAGQAAGVPIYQTSWGNPETVWGDVDKETYEDFESFGYAARRTVYAAAPAPVSEPEQTRQDEALMHDLLTHGIAIQRIAPADFLAAPTEQPSERGERQDCPHGVDDGACKQCYIEGAALTANQCVHASGIVGDDGGTPCCPLTMTPDARAPTLSGGDGRVAMTKAWGEISASMYSRMSPWEFYQAGWHASRAAAPQPAFEAVQPQAAEPKGLTDERIREISLKYCAHEMPACTYNILRYECEEDFLNLVRELNAAQRASSLAEGDKQ